jgi:ABC-type branched-subunit amino acid transport system ATPase component
LVAQNDRFERTHFKCDRLRGCEELFPRLGEMTVLIVEQDALSALEQADRGYVLDVGHITMTGSAQGLLDDPRVKEAYLGL